MERDRPWTGDAGTFLRYLDRLRKFAIASAEGILGRNPEAEEVGEEALHALVLAWLAGGFPESPFGWLKQVVWRLCGKKNTAFHARLARLGGEEARLEDLSVPDRKETDGLEWARTETERVIFLREVLPHLTPKQKETYQTLRRMGGVKPAARALGKEAGNLRKTLRAIQEKARNLLRNVPPPHLRVEGKE